MPREIIGIICEYNPFHNGHLHHINKIKKKYPNSLIVLVMSGYFTMRGEISILSKEDKTKIALDNNIDIVLELPIIYNQSADTFAHRSIEILNHFKVDKIIFGSESNDISTLTKIVDIQLNDSTYNNKVKELMTTGINYPTAMAKALNINIEYTPNDLLGISYIKAIKQINNNIVPETIKRTNDFHDNESNEDIVSASNIREKLKSNKDISKYIPYNISSYLKDINYNILFNILKYKIITDTNLDNYLTVDEGIENRLKQVVINSTNIEELITNTKTKRYTYNKINRMLLHILISLKKEHSKNNLEYIKILGFNKQGQEYISSIKKDIEIPTSPISNSTQLQYELNTSLIYDLITNSNTYKYELSNNPKREQ